MEKLINIGNLSYFKTLMDNKNNEKFGITELAINTEGHIDLTPLRTLETPGKMFKITDPNNKGNGTLYYGTNPVTIPACKLFDQNTQAYLQAGSIILTTGKYGLLYAFPSSIGCFFQIELYPRESVYLARVFDTTENYNYVKMISARPEGITVTQEPNPFTYDESTESYTVIGAKDKTYGMTFTLANRVDNFAMLGNISFIDDSKGVSTDHLLTIEARGATDTEYYTVISTSNLDQNFIYFGCLEAGTVIRFTYTSASYNPDNVKVELTFDCYGVESADSNIASFVRSEVKMEEVHRRLAEQIISSNMDSNLSYIHQQLSSLLNNTFTFLDEPALGITFSLNNEDLRLLTSDGSGQTSVSVSFSDSLELNGDSMFNASLAFQSSINGTSFDITPPTNKTIKMTGDDVENNVFTPVANKAYDLAFYWNGLFMNCIVRGVDSPAKDKVYKVTFTNTGTQAKHPNYTIYEGDTATGTPLVEVPIATTKTFTTTSSTLYLVASNAVYTPNLENPLNCEMITRTNDSMTVKLTGTPCSADLSAF